MAASREELVEHHDALAAGLAKRMSQAKAVARAEGREFDAEKWATGRSSTAVYKFGAPPIVAGVPTMGQALAGMNAYDVSRMVVWGSAAAAAGFMFGWRYKRWLAVEPATVAGFFGVGAGSVCVFQGTWSSMARLTGWSSNGNALRPGYEGYVEDAAAPITKMARPGVESGFQAAAPAGVPDAGSVRV
ncbi:hypothetical protein FNF27_08249 [Cafeteria roenbergensis]|uniref:NADH-ubiquinone oxidoreductase 21kDa subunit N-terminal domain-containing protein n=1 Tax=Cafeteria roenbergensis TaxID=33653 RepID=A0A5A8D556_CAFRO|nr:hypothetical protein FNF27_08249 [Cafeteria roenbergensis]